MRCEYCQDSKRIMGGGMIYQDCSCVNQKIATKNDNVTIDKRSKEYRDAITKIMKTNNEYTRDDAIRIFDEAYDKV